MLEWLSALFGGKFVLDKARSFESGRQTDARSCGLFSINAIRHEVLDEPLLNQKQVCSERVRWFNTLCQTIYDTVGESLIPISSVLF